MSPPNLRCPDCRSCLVEDDGRVACGNPQCAACGLEKPVWRALEDAGLAAEAATGLPRQVHQGLPVPWVAAATRERVWWRAMDARRLAAAHNHWLCQVCGQPLPQQAWVLATPDGTVLQAALHQDCVHLALRSCPHLSGGASRATPRLSTRAQLTAGGRPLDQAPPSEPDFLHQWHLADPAP